MRGCGRGTDQAMQKAGIQQVAIQAVTDPEEMIETFAKEIIKRWK